MDRFVVSLLAVTKTAISADSVSQCDAREGFEWSRLSSGTSPERIAPESLTPWLSRSVHRNISRRTRFAALDQVRTRSTSRGLASNSLKFFAPRSRIRTGQESTGFTPTSPLPLWERVDAMLWHRGRVRGSGPSIDRNPSSGALRAPPSPTRGERKTALRPQLVFATRGGVAVVMKLVASSRAGPSGVGIFIQNGTRMRVPATGANAISMLRWAVRYLITGRSGI